MTSADHSPTADRQQFFIELLLVLVLVALPVLVWIGRGDVENDEAIYSYAVNKIVETGNWLTPAFIYPDDPPFLEKPPLKFWLTALSLELGVPHNSWGLRFVDAVLTVLIFAYLVAIGLRVGGRWAGLASGLVFFAFGKPLLSHGLLANNMESAVVLQYAGSIYHFMAWADGSRRKGLHAIMIGLLFVLGFMSKFVAALFLPVCLVVVVLVHPQLLRRFLADITWWLGAGVLAAGLIAPWFIYQHQVTGPDFWNIIFGDHVVKRLTQSLDPTHLNPWYFYQHFTGRVVIECGAGLAYLAGLFFVLRDYSTDRDPKITALLVWYLVPVTAMSLMTSKLMHYLYPFLPGVAVVCGLGLSRLARLRLQPIGEYRYGRWLGSVGSRVAAIPMQWFVFALAALPIAAGYGATLHGMSERPAPFRELEACLRDMGMESSPSAFFERHQPSNHVFTYYNLESNYGAESGQLNQLLFGDRPRPVWLPETKYHAFVSSDERGSAIEAQRIELAMINVRPGETEAVILLLPGEFAACGPRLQEAGSKPVHPATSAGTTPD